MSTYNKAYGGGGGSLQKMDTCPTTLNMIFNATYYLELHIPISSLLLM